MNWKSLFKFMAILVIVAQLAACATPAAHTQQAQPPAPVATEAPAATMAPAATEAPAATQVPVATEAPAATQAPAAQGTLPEIVVAVWSGPEHDNAVKVAEAYTKETGNKVTIEEIAREAYFDKLTTTFVAGGSDYDAAYISSDWPPAWVKANALVDLSQYYNDPKVAMPGFDINVFKPAINYFNFDGKVYAFPSEGDTAWMFYRKDILDAKGIKPPETWDEYLAAAKALNNPPDMYGAVIGAKPDEALWDFMFYLFGHGGEILDKDHKVVINNEAGVKALTFYSELLTKEKVVPPDVNTYGYNEILTTLQQGKSALGLQWMAATQTLQDCTQSPKVCKDGQPLLQYTEIPGLKQPDGTIKRSTGGSQWGWVIPSGGKNPVAAYKFIEWLTSKEGATMWALNGGIPSNTLALSDPAVVAKIPQFELLAKIMPYRQIVPPTTVTADLVTVLDEAIVAAVSGTKTPQQALDDAAVKMKKLMSDAGYPQ